MKQTKRICVFNGGVTEKDGGPPENALGAVTWFSEKVAQIPEEYKANAEISFVAEYESSLVEIEISYMRPETDEEEAAREADARERVERRRRDELRTLAALQAKYGKNS